MILVTGGTGFVGRNLISHLVTLGYQVRTLLRPSAESPRLPRGISVEVAVCSLTDERGLRGAMKDVDVIFHLASAERSGIHGDLSGVDVDGTQAVVQAARQAGVKRIFYLSHLGADRASAFPVFKVKAIAEGLIMSSGLPYTIFRSGVVYGPGDQFTEPLAKLLRAMPGVFLIPESGRTHLQPLGVEDLVTCFGMALEDERTVNQIYSIGGIEFFTYRDVIDLIKKKINVKRWMVSLSPAYVRSISIWLDQVYPTFPVSMYWLDYLAADRTCAVDTLPRVFGLMPARFGQNLAYLK
jgi:uncharacterized protein YbjT (DUF2867 family)